MKIMFVLLIAIACSGCTSSRLNHDYSRSPVPELTGYGLPESPHTF